MKFFAKIILTAAVHIAFLFTAYGTSFFGLDLPSYAFLTLWLAASSMIALVVYYQVLSNSNWLMSMPYRVVSLGACATIGTFVSLYVGVFLAFNYFGT